MLHGKRILHIFKTYSPDTFGGIEQVIENICRETARQGYENTILTLSSQPRVEEFDYAKIIRYPVNLIFASCPVSIKLWRLFKLHILQADIVHYHFPWPYAELLHIWHKVKKPTIVTYHSDIVKQRFLKKLYAPLMKKFLTAVDQIIVTSPNYKNTSNDLKPYLAKTDVIPIGIDQKKYPVASIIVSQQWRQNVGENFMLFIGVLRYYKGLFTLLEAAQDSPVTIVIAGDGPLKGELIQKAEAKALSNVKFIGAVTDTDKIALLELCGAVVLPSHLRSEAFGVSLLEGLMFGKPLISTEIGTGTSYVNEHNITGLVVPPNDPVCLKKAMQRIFHDKELANKMGKAGRLRYEKYFTESVMGSRYIDLYNTLSFKKNTKN